MMFGYSERASKAKVKHHVGGDEPATVFKIGRYEVTVPGTTFQVADGDGPAVTYVDDWRRPNTDPRQTFPNMDVYDGEIRLPVADLVDEVLKRIDPVELAEALWTNDDVRRAFIEAACQRYRQPGLDDADRRALIDGLLLQVHSAALDKLAEAMATQEYAARETAYRQQSQRNFRYWLVSVTETLRAYPEALAALRERHGLDTAFRTDPEEKDFSIGGKHWNEARDFWRAEVLRQFPSPVPAPQPDDAEAF